MKWQNRFLLNIVVGTGLSFISAQDTTFVLDSTLSSSLPQSLTNSIQIGDVNNDGINDIVISGYDEFNRTGGFVDVIRGNSDGTLTMDSQTDFGGYPDTIAGYWEYYGPDSLPVGVPIGGIGGVDLADANRDGWIDIYFNGCARSKLLINSSGSFSASTDLENMSLTYSDGKWGDVNMDGAPDLFVMGVNEYTDNILNELFINDGTELEEDPTTIFPALFNGSSSWGDYDNDGDPDLVICGQTADKTASVSRFYQNEPTGRLTELTTADEVGGLKAGAFRFVDLDSDGDQDMVMSGWNKIQGKLVTWILRNEPLGTFSLIPNQIDFAVAYGTIDAIDFNLDGFPDFVIAGADSVTHHAGRIHSLSGRVYLNNGDGTFSVIDTIPGARVARFADINHDSIPDLIASGTTEFGNDSSTFSHVYLNTTEGTNHLSPEAPAALTAFAVSTRAIFTWGAGTDDSTNTASLSYNVRIGTTSGGNELMSSSVPYNASSVGQRLIREFNEIPHGTYYWAVQTMDGSGNVSDWTLEDTLFIARLVTSTQSLPGVYFATAGWADYNEDDMLDLALTGVTFSGGSITNLFGNEDGLLSQDLTQDIEAVFGGHLSWVDYTNDGHLDLSLSGFQIINFYPYRVTKLYKYDNGIYMPDTDSEIYTDANYDGIPDYWMIGGTNNHHWGDYDNDGDLDLIQGGWDNYNIRHLDVFYNDNGILRLDTNQTNLVPISPAIVQWVDLNRDGYLDLVSIGADDTTETLGMRVYLNNDTYVLSSGLSWDSNIYGVTAGAIAFADYNSDGYDDFALTGKNSDEQLITYVVTNDTINNTFNISPGHTLEGVYYGRPAWGDYDADGDLDLLVTGQSSTVGQLGSEPLTVVYNQQEDGSFSVDQTLSIDSVGISFSQWGDYDLDGDLDLFLAGFKANQDVVAQVYDNLEGIENANEPPNAPYLLDDTDIDDDKVTLTWSAPVDPANPGGGSTLENGLRYQIQIGSYDSQNDHAISTGHYGIGEIGKINLTKKILRNIPEGTYGWRVRAIDHGYATSDWSSTNEFYIDVTAPTVNAIRTNYVSSEQVILVVEFDENFNLNLNVDPLVVILHPDNPDLDDDGIPDTISVDKTSYSGTEWAGALTLPTNYSGKAISIRVSGARDERGNTMAVTSIYKTPETIFSQKGGTAISADGNVTVLLPQNAVDGDIEISITAQNVKPNESSFYVNGITYLISDLYDVEPFEQSLDKPGILRIGFPDTTCLITEELNQYFNLECKNESRCDSLNGEWFAVSDTGITPFIGMIDTTITDILPLLKLGGSEISINGNPFIQVQIDTFGTYGAFITFDGTLAIDSVDGEKITCQPRIFSPGGTGSVFEFVQTNIIYSLDEPEDVTARIFNLSGRLKKTIKPETSGQTGHQVLNWDGKDSNGDVVPSGLYIVTLEKDDTVLKTTVGVLNR